MKTTTIAIAMTMLASTVSAADLDIGGQTISAGGELDMNYTTGTELWALDFTPKAGLNAFGVDFSVDTTLDVMSLNDASKESFTGLDFAAGYTIGGGLRAYTEVGTNSDLEFGDVTMGATFNF